MPNTPVDLPEDFCNFIDEVPDCVKKLLEGLTPEGKDSLKDKLLKGIQEQSLSLENQATDLLNNLRTFENELETQLDLSNVTDVFDSVLKCPNDPAVCGPIAAAAEIAKGVLNQAKAVLDPFTGNALLSQSIGLSVGLIEKASSLNLLSAFDVECPDEETDAAAVGEEIAEENDDPTRPTNAIVEELSSGLPTSNGIQLSWEPVPADSGVLAYEVYINNVLAAVVPRFVAEFLIRDLPNDNQYEVCIVPVNKDPNPIKVQGTCIKGVRVGNNYPVPSPIITESQAYSGGAYLRWDDPNFEISIQDFVDNTDYQTKVVDSDNLIFSLQNKFQEIVELRNDSFQFFNLYNLSGATISYPTIFQVTLDPILNQNIGISKTDQIFVDYEEIQDAEFTQVSGNTWIYQFQNTDFNLSTEILEVDFLRRLRPLDGELDTYDLTDFKILDHRTIQFSAPDLGESDLVVTLDPNIQTFTTDIADELEVSLQISGGNTQAFEAEVLNLSPLEVEVAVYEEPVIPTLVSVTNVTQGTSYILSGSILQLGRNFQLGANFNDILQSRVKIRKPVDYINTGQYLLTTLDSKFTKAVNVYNQTRNADYTLSGASLNNAFTLIQLDSSKSTNSNIGLRENDLVRAQSSDVTLAKFIPDDPESNNASWRIAIQNPELGSSAFIKEIISITNDDRPGQFYDLTNASIIDNYITLRRADGLNEVIGIDPRDRLRVDYIYQRFNTTRDFEIYLDEGGSGFQFLQRTGRNNSFFTPGTRALIQGTNQEPFTIDSSNNTLSIKINGDIETVVLTEGEDLDSIDLVDDIASKTRYLSVGNSSGSLLFGSRRVLDAQADLNALGISSGSLSVDIQNGDRKLVDYVEVLSGSALGTLGFSPGSFSFGESYQLGVPLIFRVDAVTKSGQSTAFSLTGPNFAQVIPSEPIFDFNNVVVNSQIPGYIYNGGSVTDVNNYALPVFGWNINFDLESANRKIIEYERLALATIRDSTNQIISLPFDVFNFDDIQAIYQVEGVDNLSSYDLTNISVSNPSPDNTLIDLDETLATNQSLGMPNQRLIAAELPNFYVSYGLANNVPFYPIKSLTPVPDVAITGQDIDNTSNREFNVFGVDPYVKIRNVLAETPGYNGGQLITSGVTQEVRLSFEAVSTEGVDSVALWWKTKRKGLIPVNNLSSPLTLSGGSDAANQRGLYVLEEEILVSPADPIFDSVASIATSSGSSTITVNDAQLITSNGQYNSLILEFVTGALASLKYKITASSLANNTITVSKNLSGVLPGDVFKIHSRNFPSAWPEPANAAFDVTTVPVNATPVSDLIDPQDGFVLMTMNKNGDVINYVSDNNQNAVLFASNEAIKFNDPQSRKYPFNIPGLGAIRFNDPYNVVDVNYNSDQNWDVNIVITSLNPKPTVKLRADSQTNQGEKVIGEKTLNL